MNYLFVLLFVYFSYIYRYKLFIYYCKLCDYFNIYENVHTQITHMQNETCISFDYKTLCTKELSQDLYYKNGITDKLLILKKKDYYIIHPNLVFEIVPTPFIICEVVIDDKSFDITEYLKPFYIKNNIILTRPFIIYLLYTFLDIQLSIDDNYSIKYIDTNANIKIIDTDINIYQYTI